MPQHDREKKIIVVNLYYQSAVIPLSLNLKFYCNAFNSCSFHIRSSLPYPSLSPSLSLSLTLPVSIRSLDLVRSPPPTLSLPPLSPL
jgi:hypothetical protein